MLPHDYLSLRLNRLREAEEWPKKADGLAFIFPNAGSGRYVSGSMTNHFEPGDVLVLNSSTGAKVCVGNGNELVFWSFFARLDHLFPLFADDEIYLIQDLEERLKIPMVFAAATPVAAECHRLVAGVPPQFNLEHRSYLLRLVATVLATELSGKRPAKTGFVRMDDHLTTVFESLSIDEIMSLSVGELAARFSCGRRHLNRLFHHHFGCSVASLRMEMRLLKAATLLRDEDAKVITIAEQCGFHNLGLFNICFKRRFCLSPGKWRKRPIKAESQVDGELMLTHPKCRMLVQGLCPWRADPSEIKALPTKRIQPQKEKVPRQPVLATQNNGKPARKRWAVRR